MKYYPLIIYLLYAFYRLWELVYYSLFNEKEMKKRGAHEYGKGISSFLRASYIIIFPAAILEYFWAGRSLTVYWIGGWSLVVVVAAVIRHWVIQTLGGRGGYWTVKVLVFSGQKIITHGPFKYLKHPNYVSLIFEVLGLTLILKTYLSFVLIFPFYSVLIYFRIKTEEKAMSGI